jgi:hypothetical protein
MRLLKKVMVSILFTKTLLGIIIPIICNTQKKHIVDYLWLFLQYLKKTVKLIPHLRPSPHSTPSPVQVTCWRRPVPSPSPVFLCSAAPCRSHPAASRRAGRGVGSCASWNLWNLHSWFNVLYIQYTLYLSSYLSIYRSVDLSIYRSIDLSIYLSNLI